MLWTPDQTSGHNPSPQSSDGAGDGGATRTVGIFILAGVAAFLALFAFMPFPFLVATPLRYASGLAHSATLVSMVLSPVAAVIGGGTLLARQAGPGGRIVGFAGVVALLGYWGPIGWLCGGLLLIASAKVLRLRAKAAFLAAALPVLVYVITGVVFSPWSEERQLAQTEARISEVTGTLKWQEEWPSLRAQRDRLKSTIDSKTRRFGGVLAAVASAVGLAVAFGFGRLIAVDSSTLLGLRYGGAACLALGLAALVGMV